MHERAAGCFDSKGNRVRNGVVDVDKPDFHAAERDRAAGVDDMQLDLVHQAVLTQLVFDQAERQRCAVERHIDLGEQKRQTADVVLMTVGQYDTAHALHILLNVAEIGDHQIHAEHIAVGKRHAAIDDDDIVLTLDQCDVFSDLIQTAQKGYAHRRFFDGSNCLGTCLFAQLF